MRGNFFRPKTYYFSPRERKLSLEIPPLGEKWYIFWRKKCYALNYCVSNPIKIVSDLFQQLIHFLTDFDGEFYVILIYFLYFVFTYAKQSCHLVIWQG